MGCKTLEYPLSGIFPGTSLLPAGMPTTPVHASSLVAVTDDGRPMGTEDDQTRAGFHQTFFALF